MARIRDMKGCIEPNIRPLCEALNAVAGVRTIASCQGHVCPCSPPYVMFESPLAFAAALEKALREDSMANLPRLRVFWEVKGMFDGTYTLRFYLHSPDLAQSTRHWFRLNLMEQRLKADFRVLTAIILMLSERWPMKRHVNAGDNGRYQPLIREKTHEDRECTFYCTIGSSAGIFSDFICNRITC
ncbi:hypothetical protein CAY53_02195 [Desulfobulbus oralis]|uniref:Uncharacterized protein n=1 Tax=Desulfobulbus oralis TaxID=1986146 RepID=A0A2L1GL99_9BACT|nr:hypothetical protein CAY53_02195 [Desulfobulbus oralis]